MDLKFWMGFAAGVVTAIMLPALAVFVIDCIEIDALTFDDEATAR